LEGARGVRFLRRLHLAVCRGCTPPKRLAPPPRRARSHARVGGHEPGPSAAGFRFCRPHHLLLLYAGRRYGQRPPGDVLPAPGSRGDGGLGSPTGYRQKTLPVRAGAGDAAGRNRSAAMTPEKTRASPSRLEMGMAPWIPRRLVKVPPRMNTSAPRKIWRL